MSSKKDNYTSSNIMVLGKAALILAGFFLVQYNVGRFLLAAPADQGFLVGTVALAFLGLITVVIAGYLKKMEARLLQNKS